MKETSFKSLMLLSSAHELKNLTEILNNYQNIDFKYFDSHLSSLSSVLYSSANDLITNDKKQVISGKWQVTNDSWQITWQITISIISYSNNYFVLYIINIHLLAKVSKGNHRLFSPIGKSYLAAYFQLKRVARNRLKCRWSYWGTSLWWKLSRSHSLGCFVLPERWWGRLLRIQ